MVDTLYHCRQKDMGNFLEDDWLSPEPTPMLQLNHFFDQVPSTSLPPSAPGLPHGSGYLQPRMSPAFGQGVQDLIYTQASSGSMAGLRMTHATAHPTSRSTVSNMSSPRQGASQKTAWYDPSAMARSRSLTAPTPQTVPLTPQTAGMTANLMSQPVSIAPHPSHPALRQNKRPRHEEASDHSGSPKRHRSNSAIQPLQTLAANKAQTELSEEDQLLLKLKHEENLPWKDIAREFETRLGRTYQVPALQMRHKRLKERMRTWTEDDLSALEAAYEYWEKSKFEIVSQKMLEFGAQEKWPAKYCERKWEELHPEGSGPGTNPSNPGQTTSTQHSAVSAVSLDNWPGPDAGSEAEFGQSALRKPLTSRSPANFLPGVTSGSPGQRSPASSFSDQGLDGIKVENK